MRIMKKYTNLVYYAQHRPRLYFFHQIVRDWEWAERIAVARSILVKNYILDGRDGWATCKKKEFIQAVLPTHLLALENCRDFQPTIQSPLALVSSWPPPRLCLLVKNILHMLKSRCFNTKTIIIVENSSYRCFRD